jgi:asparagine synthase (glutamine-hydrolysing)
MCGFSGFWDLAGGPEPELAALARAMADTLAHRGPDDAGVFVDPPAGYAVGHRRLTILDLSPAGHQPMATPDGRFVLSYNGEVYNHAELRRDLEAQGVRFRGTSDTETVLHALARWGVERALERFVGMFAFALWDGLERTLVLARDRLGIKPLYYGIQGGTQGGAHDGVFFFGSELKALHRHPRFRRTIDKGALALYFRFAYVPAPHSIWEGIAKLPPGTWALVKSPTEVSVRTYWSARAVAEAGLRDPLALDEEEAVEELDRLLRDAVKLRMLGQSGQI